MTIDELYSKENLAKLKIAIKRLNEELLLMRKEGDRYPNLGDAGDRIKKKYA